MPERPITCVILWVEGEVPEDHDWSAVLPEGVTLAAEDESGTPVRVKSFPWNDVHHEVNWWITRPMTFDEWVRMDDAESAVLAEILGDDFMGTAGPIPFPPKDEDA